MNKINLIWIIVLLALLNLTTIGSFIYHRYNEKHEAETQIVTGNTQNPLNGRFFRQEMKFNEEQMEQFLEANRKFKPRSKEIIQDINLLKNQIFDELNNENADTTKLKQLTDNFGKLHAELKSETNDFYLKLRRISTKEQIDKLNNAFAPLFYQEGIDAHQQGKGFKHRHGRENEITK